jgi:hypothetical protein
MDPVFCPNCDTVGLRWIRPAQAVRHTNKRDTTLPSLLNAFAARSIDAFGQLRTTLYKTMISELRRALRVTLINVTNIVSRKESRFHRPGEYDSL